jgi:hypothetical protein
MSYAVDMSQSVQEILKHRDAMCPRCGYNLRGLASPICPECQLTITPENVLDGKRIKTRGVAIALLIVTIIGFFVLMHTLASWKNSLPDAAFRAAQASSVLVLAAVLVWPSIVWFRQRQAIWKEMDVYVRTPWIRWASWMMVAMAVNVAMWVPAVIAQIAWVFSILSSPLRNAYSGWLIRPEYIFNMLIAVPSSICLIGLSSAQTRGRLSVWVQRTIIVLATHPALYFVLHLWRIAKE